METGKLIFITGGARSGKSSMAEKDAISLGQINGGNLHYIATSHASDDEMIQRIKHHQTQREASGVTWKTWECPVDVHQMAPHLKKSDIVLLDCLTVLLSNEFFRNEELHTLDKDRIYQEKIYQKIQHGIFSIAKSVNTLFVVSNEVLAEPLSDKSFIMSYASLLGHLHQTLVRHAEKAYVVESGCPILMKEKS